MKTLKILEIITLISFLVSTVAFWNTGSGWFLSLAVISFIGSIQAHNTNDINRQARLRRGEF